MSLPPRSTATEAVVPERPVRAGMPGYSVVIVLVATFLSFAALYGPQPLLPVLAETFDVSIARAATIITWSLFPMCVAPVFVGLVLQVIAPRRLIAWCLVGLGVSEFVFYAMPVFAGLQAVRFVQGLLIAALLPGVMTYIAGTARRMRRVMVWYVTASVMGGLSGRIVLGLVAAVLPWERFFAGIGVALLLCAAAAFRLPAGAARPRGTIQLGRLMDVLRDPLYRRLYGAVFAGFFVFTAILNFMPFRLQQLDGSMDTGRIAWTYSGFVLGMAASLLSLRVTRWLGSELRSVAVGLLALGAGVLLAWGSSVLFIMAAVSAAAVGFFLMHSVLSGYLNSRAGSAASQPDEAPSVNGLYISIYYLGGTIGSFVPGILYVRYGWTAFVLTLLGLLAGGLALTVRCMRSGAAEAVAPEHQTSA